MLEWPTVIPLRGAPPPRPRPPLGGRPRPDSLRGGIVERLAEQSSCIRRVLTVRSQLPSFKDAGGGFRVLLLGSWGPILPNVGQSDAGQCRYSTRRSTCHAIDVQMTGDSIKEVER